VPSVEVAEPTWRGLLPRAVPAAVVLGVVAAPVALAVPIPVLAAGTVALGLVVAVFCYPPLAAYTLVVLTPLIAGLGRSSFIPVVRPHEALAILVGAGLALNGVTRLLAGRVRPPRLQRMDAAIVLMAVTSSALPLLWLLARGRAPTTDDILYSLTLWKFYVVFVIVRLSVRRDSEVRRCLWLSMAAASVVALVAVLQSLQLFGVVDVVGQLFPTEDPGGVAYGRGTATLGSSIAVGDVMAYNLAIAVGWLLRGPRPPLVLVPLAGVFLVGGLASGQFSGAIAIAVSVTAVAAVTGRLRRMALVALPALLLGAVLLRPVIGQRLSGFDSTTGLPQSWDVRLVNLHTYFWSELFSGHAYLLGVRPAARILAPEPWREYVYIESGYTWLLWVGGVPLLLAFAVFVGVAARQAIGVAGTRRGAPGAAGIAAVAALAVTVVLMALDPHLVMRGAADLLFTLLALAVVSDVRRRSPVQAALAETDPPRRGRRALRVTDDQ
jgi:hypothetical protein